MDKKVLIVDDDEKLRELLKEYLEGYGWKPLTLADGSLVLEIIKTQSPDIVVLDIMLGRENGLDILKKIRARFDAPVIMLTAKGDEEDRIVGLELGADDYMPKPFNPRELLARMNAIARRTGARSEKEPGKKHEIIESGGLRLNKDKRTLFNNRREIALSATEYKIMEALMTRPNRVLDRDQLMNFARGRDAMAFDRSVDVHISNLRAKMKSLSPDFNNRIKTVWGAGYMFEEIP
ncbi:MAG: response regulator transcription factor [Desulfobacterales bacterium]|nr:response regulator transcription factor [Desulfobacterales bacterium]